MGLGLVHLMGLMKKLCRGVVRLGFMNLMEQLS